MPFPLQEISQETLIHVGFSVDRAQELWERWTNQPVLGPRCEVKAAETAFLPWILAQLDAYEDENADMEDDDEVWYRCLDACGIATELQEAIMDPAPPFRCIRNTDSCLYWIRYTIDARYAAMVSHQREAAKLVVNSRPAISTKSRECRL